MTVKELMGCYSICELVICEQWGISLSVELTNKRMVEQVTKLHYVYAIPLLVLLMINHNYIELWEASKGGKHRLPNKHQRRIFRKTHHQIQLKANLLTFLN